jgi:alpha-ketoglutarate-dependent taurine dioxygenase
MTASLGVSTARANVAQCFLDFRTRAGLVVYMQFPLIVEPPSSPDDASRWVADHHEELTGALHRHGAILFKGFGVRDREEFENFIVAASSGEWVAYREAATPRSHVGGHIYTSTEFPPQYRIYLHNENSHVTTWPARLFFFCDTAPARGGQTPIADCRKIHAALDPRIRERFLRTGWLYKRTFGYGLGFSWQQVFNVGSKAELAQYCLENSMVAEWLDDKRLRVKYRRWSALRHPVTGDDVWFNHGLFYNVWNLTPDQQRFLASFGAAKMPYDTAYGDGAPIETSTLEHLHAAYESAKVLFDWRPGDVLMIDNMLAAHGREPYQGERRILVGMTGRIDCRSVADPRTYSIEGL